MPNEEPNIDGRSSDELLADAKRIAPHYTDEWNPDAGGPGAALLDLFAEMGGDVIERLDHVPEKHRVAFFDRLGFDAEPPQPARLPLTFAVADGVTENVPIRAGTQAVAPPKGTRPEQTFTVPVGGEFEATPANLAAVYSVDPARDRIVNHYDETLTDPNLFDGENAQKHVLYVGDDEMLTLAPGGWVQLNLTTATAERTLRTNLVWEFYGEIPTDDDDSEEGWHRLEPSAVTADERTTATGPTIAGTVVKLDDGGFVTVGFKQWQQNVSEAIANLHVDTQRQLFARVALAIDPVATDGGFLTVELDRRATLAGALSGYVENAVRTHVDDRLLDQATATLATTTEAAARDPPAASDRVTLSFQLPEGATTTETTVNGTKTKWLRARLPTEADPEWSEIVGDAERPPEDLFAIEIDGLTISGGLFALAPDEMRHNDVPIPVTEADGVFLFGRVPRQLDTFYLSSEEAFSKRGSPVSVRLTGDPSASDPNDPPSVSVPAQLSDGTSVVVDVATGPIAGVVTVSSDHEERGSVRVGANAVRCVEISSALAEGEKTVKAQFTDDEGNTTSDTADVTVDATAGSGPTVSWEYWNGTNWDGIPNLDDGTCGLRGRGAVRFAVPGDFEPTGVSGLDGHWIRARLVDGDYGRVTYHETDTESSGSDDKAWTQDTSGVHPPQYHEVTVSYGESVTPSNCLAYNNLEYGEDHDEVLNFHPFVMPREASQTLYLGFDRPLRDGPMNVFFDLTDVEYEREFAPRIRWGATVEDEWVEPGVRDETKSLTRSGVVGLTFPRDTTPRRRFDRPLHWLRATVTGSEFEVAAPSDDGSADAALDADEGGRYEEGSDEDAPDETDESTPCGAESHGRGPCEPTPCGTVLSTVPASGRPGRRPPTAVGIHPNTGWAANLTTVEGELLGSSDGRLDQQFSVSTPPVLTETVWVDELATLSAGARTALTTSQPDGVRETTTDRGEPRAFWVAWERVDDHFASGPDDRHYVIDRTAGVVTFGDGVNGAIPPRGRDNVRIDYATGGGAGGNVAAGAVADLKSSVAFVDGVTNPVAGDGGAPAETTAHVLDRAPKQLRDRNRAVAAADFERIALSASRKLASARCIPAMDEGGAFAPGWVTLLVVPDAQVERPIPSLELVQRVTETVGDHAPATLVEAEPSRLVVRGPSYVVASVRTTVAPAAVGSVAAVEAAATNALRAFLHPLSGGPDGDGWAFGDLPCLSDLFAVLEGVAGVDHVESLAVTFAGSGAEVTVTDGDDPPAVAADTLVHSGTHDIDATGGL